MTTGIEAEHTSLVMQLLSKRSKTINGRLVAFVHGNARNSDAGLLHLSKSRFTDGVARNQCKLHNNSRTVERIRWRSESCSKWIANRSDSKL